MTCLPMQPLRGENARLEAWQLMPHTRLHVPEVPLRDLLGDLVWMEGHVSGVQKKALDQVAQAKQVVPGSDPGVGRPTPFLAGHVLSPHDVQQVEVVGGEALLQDEKLCGKPGARNQALLILGHNQARRVPGQLLQQRRAQIPTSFSVALIVMTLVGCQRDAMVYQWRTSDPMSCQGHAWV